MPFFVLHDAALLVEFRLIDGPQHVSHAVRLHPQGHIQRRGRNILEIVRPVRVRRSVHAGRADAVEGLEIVVVVILTAVEHEVFEQVRKARLARFFIFRADVVPDVDGHDGRFVIFVHDHAQTVLQDELLVGNVDLVGRADLG